MQRHEGPRARQTRIVATLGRTPAEGWEAFLTALVEAGVDVLRLNLSHADPDHAKETEILAWANRPVGHLSAPPVAVMADLQGPKCRIGRLPADGIALDPGAAVELRREGDHGDAIPVPEPVWSCLRAGLCDWLAAHPADRPSIAFGDGDLIVAVEGVGADTIAARVAAGGVLHSKKGLTVREIDLALDPFPPKDQDDLRLCLRHGVDFVALSFVRTPAAIERVRAFIADHVAAGSDPPAIIAKIETLSAVADIDAILAAADGIMVARGDLGLQLGHDEVPAVQKRLVVAARRHAKPCIIATQMLESMISAPLPTRAEATDIFNAIVDGGDAVMLSGETSVGSRPCRVVEVMDGIARKAELFRVEERTRRTQLELPPVEGHGHVARINAEFARTAVQFADHLPAFAIVCFSRTGRTPERISRYRPAVPVMAFCATDAVARRCLLYWGVHPIVLRGFDAQRERLAEVVRQARAILRRRYAMRAGDAIVVTAGIDWVRGGTNTLQVLVEDHAAADAAPP